MQKVGGAIQRIDDPGIVRLTLFAAFFSDNGVVRIVFLNGADDGPLGVSIGLAEMHVGDDQEHVRWFYWMRWM